MAASRDWRDGDKEVVVAGAWTKSRGIDFLLWAGAGDRWLQMRGWETRRRLCGDTGGAFGRFLNVISEILIFSLVIFLNKILLHE